MTVMSPQDLRKAQDALAQQGYVVIPEVVSGDRLAALAASLAGEFDRARASGELVKGGGSRAGHLNCFPGEQSRFVWDELVSHGIVDLARAWDPDKAERARVTMNYNLPGSVVQHCHMDGVFTDAFLICNVAVVDTDLENGAIDMLPGTNRDFYPFYRYALERKYKLSTRLPMRQGDVLLRLSTTWHRGMPNRTMAARPLLSVTFGEQGAPEGDPFLVNEGRPLFYANWFSTSRMGQLRERTFVAAPWTYSAVRFVRSLHGNRGYSSW